MSKILVTGSAGQTGRYLCEYITGNTDHEIIAAAKLSQMGLLPALLSTKSVVTPIHLEAIESIKGLIGVERPDYFINLAAHSSSSDSWEDIRTVYRINTVAVLEILNAIKEYCPNCRFLNAGSSYELSDHLSPYSLSKKAAHDVVDFYRKYLGLFAIQPKLFPHSSPRQSDKFVLRKITKGVAQISQSVKQGRPFSPLILGNLDIKLHLCHAKDIVRGLWLLINQEEPVEYSLINKSPITIRKLVEMSFSTAGIPIRLIKDDDIAYEFNGYPIVKISQELFRAPDPSQTPELYGGGAEAFLKWTPEIGVKELIEEMVAADIKLLTNRP